MPKILENVKEDICRVTRQMLIEEGFDTLGIRSIAANCGIGMGTIYNYYHSKEEIVTEIVIEDWTVILRRMDQVNRTDILVIEKLAAIFTLLQNFIIGFHGIWMQMGSSSQKHPGSDPVQCKRYDYRNQLVERIRLAIQSKGEVNPTKDIDFCADLISRIFMSYGTETDFQFSTMRQAIEALLSGCRNS